MYNEAIKTTNKIISDKVLIEIFEKINEEKIRCEKKYQMEKNFNDKVDFLNQKWTMNYLQVSFRFIVDFYDNSNITFDNYLSFLSTFNNRSYEIKSILCYYDLNYFDKDNKNHNNKIYFQIYEDSMNIEVEIDSNDEFANDIFTFIKQKINEAPVKYDYVMKNKSKIINKVAFAQGNILGIIISLLLLFIPAIRMLLIEYFWLYPLIVGGIAYFTGFLIFTSKLNELYKPIDMEKIYDGYDFENNKNIYKNDKTKYLNTCEVIIGKNINNLENRHEIKKIEEKFKKFIPYELAIIALLTLIIFLF